MGQIVSAQKIRDLTPRWLWELRPECGHYHYELVSEFKEHPKYVTCRVCQAEERLAACRARMKENIAADVLVLDGGVDVRLAVPEQPIPGPPDPVQPAPGGATVASPPAGAQGRPGAGFALPACMLPRDDAPPLRRPDLVSRNAQERKGPGGPPPGWCPGGRSSAGTGPGQRAPGRGSPGSGRRSGDGHGQGRLFDQ